MNPKLERQRAFIIRVVYYALAAILLYAVLKYAMPLLMPFVVAFFIAFILKPFIKRLTEKTPLGRKSAAIVILLVFYIVVGGLLTFAGIRLWAAGKSFILNLPGYYTDTVEPAIGNITVWLNGVLARLGPGFGDVVDSIAGSILSLLSSLATSISGNAVNMASSVSWFVVGFFIAIIASFFFVVDYFKVTSFITRQLSPNARRLIFVIKDYIVNTLLQFVKAYAILLFVTFIEVFIGLLILRAGSPVLVAFITAIVDILPVFGTGTVLLPWAVYSLLMGDYFFGVGHVVLYAVITVVRQVLEPRVVGKQIGLYPLLTLVCMFVGARLFGFWGLFGLPVAVTVLIHLNRAGEIKLFKE